MPEQALQFQFDLAKGITLPAKRLDLLLRVSAEDNIQPNAISPLELFGDFLMVDRKMINEGAEALVRSRNAAWRTRLRISPPQSAQLVSENIGLTSAFLFATSCSIVFDVAKTTQIIYEIMTLEGAAQKYKISSEVVWRFIEVLNGCCDSFVSTGKNPREVHRSLCEDVNFYMRRENIWLDDLYDENDHELLGKLLYKAFEALKNVENIVIQLEGSKGGLWIAFAFIWLRPDETEIFLADTRVYPKRQDQGREDPRLIVRFLENRQPSPQTDAIGDWMITIWTELGKLTEPIKEINPTEHAGSTPLSCSPWMSARYQIELFEHSLPALGAIGHLAGAMIEVVTECGHLWNEDFSLNRLLIDICSPWYLNGYTTIVSKFGWNNLDYARQRNIANVIKTKLETKDFKIHGDDSTVLKQLISSCFIEYEKVHNTQMLSPYGWLDREDDIFEHAIHLAAQAVISSFYRELPQHLTYIPLQPCELNEHAALIREMLLIPQQTSPHKQGATFWSLRRRAILSAIPSARDVGPDDLAYAADGYVAFSSVLAHQEWNNSNSEERIVKDRAINLTDSRLIGSIEVFPGCLRRKDVSDRYMKFSEDHRPMKIASRLVGADFAVNLFSNDGKFNGIPERDACSHAEIEAKYFLRHDNLTRALLLTTYLEVKNWSNHNKQYIPQLVPTSWRRSIDVTIFAHHVTNAMSSQKQIETLAKSWRERGIAMQWCQVGTGLLTDARQILRTARNEDGRFFEAGNVLKGCRVFVRHGLVPLTECIKVAMELCQDDANWIIIA